MELIVAALVAAGAVVVFRMLAQRAATIAELVVEDGEVRIVRGGIPAAILDDVRDVVRNPPIRAARVRIVRAVRHAKVEIAGNVSDGQIQRLRNVIGSVPLARLASARRARGKKP